MKRYLKNSARKARRAAELEKHIQFLFKVTKSHQLDLDKLSTKRYFSKLTGKMETTARSPKEVKYIIDRLVSHQEANK